MPASPRPKPLLEHAAAEAEARRLVDEALETGADSLVLDGLRINKLPDGLRALAPQLKRLSLSTCQRISDLTPLRDLGELEQLDLSQCRQVDDLTPLAALPDLRSLSLAWCSQVSELAPLRRLTNLESLNLSGCNALADLSALAALPALQSLKLAHCSQITHWTPLAALVGLQSLDLQHCVYFNEPSLLAELTSLQSLTLNRAANLQDVTVLSTLTSLQSLAIGGNKNLRDLSLIAALTSLQTLRINDCPELSDLTALAENYGLLSLDLSDLPMVDDLSIVASMTRLQSLALSDFNILVELPALSGFGRLQSLRLGSWETLRELSALSTLSHLQSLHIEYCRLLHDLSALPALAELRELTLGWCGPFNSLAPLAALPCLETLNLTRCDRLCDLSVLQPLNKLRSLSVYECEQISDLSPLRALQDLQTLDVSECPLVHDLTPLQWLSSLRTLYISGCQRIDDLSPLTSCTALQSLDVTGCDQLGALSMLVGFHNLQFLQILGVHPDSLPPEMVAQTWPRLTSLNCDAVRTAPREVQSEYRYQSCLPRLERWLADLHTSGSAPCDTIKLFVLGNGRAGKTQIVRRLQGLPFDDSVASTHGVRTAQLPLLPDIGLDAQVWDFGGQDIYLGTHSLFLDDRAIYLLVWTPSLENAETVVDSGIEMHNKRLSHWLAHVRAMVGPRAPVLVVQSQCDRESLRLEAPVPEKHGFDWLQRTACSAQRPDGLDRLWPELRAAARLLHERHGDTLLPRSWVAVRDQLRAGLQAGTRVLPRADYDALCTAHDVGAPDATLAYLHQAGEVFSLPGVFNGDVVLDQAWALDGLYALLHRQQVLPVLRQNRGHFTRELLGALIWDARGFNADEQANFLSMMQRCGVCFSLGDGHYLAPDCLPALDAVQPRVDALWRGQTPAVQVTLAYPYLHDGLLRTLVSKLGEAAGLEAVYWRYGVAFYDAKAGTAVQIDCRQGDDPQRPLSGTVTLSAAELHGRDLLKELVKMLIDVAAMAEAPEQRWSDGTDASGIDPNHRRHPDGADGPRGEGAGAPVIEAVQPPVAPGALPAVHVSYAWGGDSERWVDALEQALAGRCTWRRDKGAMRPGDWISTFMDEIADARCVVVVVSDKSLKSPYCMRELLGLFQTSNGHKNRVLERIVPVVMPDAAIDTTPQRMARVRYWKEVYDTNVASAHGLDAAELGQEFVQEQQLITEFRTRVADILKWVSDVLMPRPGMPGADASVQAVAAAVQRRLDH